VIKGRVWLALALVLVASWIGATGLHIYRGDLASVVTSILGLVGTLLIFGALRSRSRKSMYPH